MDGSHDARPRAVAPQLLDHLSGPHRLNDMGYGRHPRAAEGRSRNVTRKWTWEGRAMDTTVLVHVHVGGAADV